MARGTQLGTLVDMLRAEAGRSTLAALGVDEDFSLKHKIRRSQQQLADDYDWPFLRFKPFVPTQEGERYYDMPDDLALEGVESVATWYNGLTSPVARGIGFDEYSAYDSDSDVRVDPIARWDFVWNADLEAEQIEVWPIPTSDNDRGLQFIGRRSVPAMVNAADAAVLDDYLIVLFAAAELAPEKSKQALLQSAQLRLANLRKRQTGGSGITVIGGGEDEVRRRPLELRVVRARS